MIHFKSILTTCSLLALYILLTSSRTNSGRSMGAAALAAIAFAAIMFVINFFKDKNKKK